MLFVEENLTLSRGAVYDDTAPLVSPTCTRAFKSGRCSVPETPAIPSLVIYFVIAFGLYNNAFSNIVFFQKKYRERLIPFLLRSYHLLNTAMTICVLFMTISISLEFSEPVIRVLTLLSAISIQTSNGLLSYITLIRIYHTIAHPFKAVARRTFLLTYLVLMVLPILITGMYLRRFFYPLPYGKYLYLDQDDAMFSGLFMFAVLIITSVSALISYCHEKHLKTSRVQVQAPIRQAMIATFNYYILISTVTFVLTSLPAIIITLVPGRAFGYSCSTCVSTFKVTNSFHLLMYACGMLDHSVYMALSKHYREDVRSAIRSCCNGERRVSITLSEKDLPSTERVRSVSENK